MTDGDAAAETDDVDGGGRARSTLTRAALALGGVVLVTVAFLTGVSVADGRTDIPAENSAEAGFARDMQTHHGQAVQMSMIVRDRTEDPAVRLLAYDIALTQQQQLGQMAGWLAQWGLPPTGSAAPMAWMTGPEPTMKGHDMGMAGRAMPGMASEENVQRLSTATGRDAEILFLNLMIAHHRGGVTMAQALLERSDDPVVAGLARTIVASQQADIDAMVAMLQERGQQP